MKEISFLEKTCESHPAQWEGETKNGEGVYIRYRFGILSVSIGTADRSPFSNLTWKKVFLKQIGDEYDGELSTLEMQPVLDHIFIF